MNNILLAFSLTLIAGLSTGTGSLIVLFSKKANAKFLSASLGFSAGVMVYVSMIEIFSEANESLSSLYGGKTGTLITFISFMCGMMLIALIDKTIPETSPGEAAENRQAGKTKLMRAGLFTALAMAIHNFPEGIALFVSVLHQPSAALPIVAAIAIHNITAGIAVSAPVYYATASKKKTFGLSLAVGLAQPAGALAGYLILLPFMNDLFNGILFASAAGIMVFIALDKLLPAARAYGEQHVSTYGLIAGMAVMGISLWLFI